MYCRLFNRSRPPKNMDIDHQELQTMQCVGPSKITNHRKLQTSHYKKNPIPEGSWEWAMNLFEAAARKGFCEESHLLLYHLLKCGTAENYKLWHHRQLQPQGGTIENHSSPNLHNLLLNHRVTLQTPLLLNPQRYTDGLQCPISQCLFILTSQCCDTFATSTAKGFSMSQPLQSRVIDTVYRQCCNRL